MYKDVIASGVVQTIGDYAIVRSVEQEYWNNGDKNGMPVVYYDICLDNGDGDIVYSCKNQNEAREWVKENK